MLYKKMQCKSCIKANEFEYPVCTNAGIYCVLDQNILWLGLKANVMLQSNQVKRSPQEYINDFIIQKLNPLLVVDFRLISAFLHV